jgi:myo-inositol 2-dehydrogenase/D-chiro-inositol 1-dehydrogenase
LIGLGRIGTFHAETLSMLPSVKSLVVTDAVPAAARGVAERLDVEVADSPDKLLAASVDGVVIAAATDAHPELLIAAADAGLPVFCEKPVARTMSEGVAVARRVAATGVPVQIGYPRRFDTGFTAARAEVASGELGGCTPYVRRRSTQRLRLRAISPSPEASSATAASTTSTRCGG